jgi:hypothetical protein
MKVQDSLAYPPRGLRASRVAAYLGMSENSFSNLVEEGKMHRTTLTPTRRLLLEILLAGAIAFMAMSALRVTGASAGERVQCFAERLGKDWHYRTKVPGFKGDVRGDRCWYNGPPMKPRDELYWPSTEAGPEPIVIDPDPAKMQPPWHLAPRWEGGKE